MGLCCANGVIQHELKVARGCDELWFWLLERCSKKTVNLLKWRCNAWSWNHKIFPWIPVTYWLPYLVRISEDAEGCPRTDDAARRRCLPAIWTNCLKQEGSFASIDRPVWLKILHPRQDFCSRAADQGLVQTIMDAIDSTADDQSDKTVINQFNWWRFKCQ